MTSGTYEGLRRAVHNQLRKHPPRPVLTKAASDLIQDAMNVPKMSESIRDNATHTAVILATRAKEAADTENSVFARIAAGITEQLETRQPNAENPLTVSLPIANWEDFGAISQALAGVRITDRDGLEPIQLKRITPPEFLAGNRGHLRDLDVLPLELRGRGHARGTTLEDVERTAATTMTQPFLVQSPDSLEMALVIPVGECSAASLGVNGARPTELRYTVYPQHFALSGAS